MSFGFQTFIKGTSFDVLNSMDFNFVLDTFTVSAGSGSRSYNSYPACDLVLVPVNVTTVNDASSSGFSYSQSGNTVSWYSPRPMKLAVMAAPKVGSEYPGSSFTFQSLNSSGVTRIAPNFTPYCLVQVLDFTPSVRVYQTSVPAGSPVMIFHRGIAESNRVLFFETTQNGYVSLDVKFQELNIPTRFYIFSNYLVNAPDWGFFMYRNNEIVWHSNCLPLRLNRIVADATGTSRILETDYPTAVQSSVTNKSNLRINANQYMEIYRASSAGWVSSAGKYRSHMEGYSYLQTLINSPSIPSGWGVPSLGYIDTAIYDQYYEAALGYN